ALNKVLTIEILTAYNEHRVGFGLNEVNEDITQKVALAHLADDTRTGSKELIAWALLYYHSVRVDLHITIGEFTRVICADARTLRRYKNHAIGRLMNKLIEQERDARQRYFLRPIKQLPTHVAEKNNKVDFYGC